MEKTRFRCHFSIIFESLWQFWMVAFYIVISEAEALIELISEIGISGLYAVIQSGAIWGVAIAFGVTLAVFLVGFMIWRKTWITLEDNLIIIERNTLKRVKNTIAIENVSAVNMERNLFHRIVGTYRIKIDTNSMTTADETDISIVFDEQTAIAFRKTVLERINTLKGNLDEKALSDERQPDELFEAAKNGKKIFRSTTKDMFMHALYSMPLFSLIISIAGIGFMIWYVANFGLWSFVQEALGGFIALVFIVLTCIYNVFKRFVTYYGFTVYRDGKDLHVKCGLIKLRSYTIPVDKISAIEIEQPFFSRIFKKYNTKVVTVGIGDEDGESSNITMSLSKEQLKEQLSELIPEYEWANFDKLISEEKAGMKVRLVKSIKWHLIVLAAILFLTFEIEAPWFVGILIPILVDAYINLLYVLSHKASEYAVCDEGLVLASGYFNKVYMICTYKKVQYTIMNYHPAAKRYGIGDGVVMLLNSAASVPYIKEEKVYEIEERILGKI